MSDVTQILNAIEQGDPSAAAQLLRLVYDELRRLAAAQLAPWMACSARCRARRLGCVRSGTRRALRIRISG